MEMDQQEGQPAGHPRKHSWDEEDQEDGTPGPPRPSDQRDERSAEAGKADERRPPLRLRTSQRAQQGEEKGRGPIFKRLVDAYRTWSATKRPIRSRSR